MTPTIPRSGGTGERAEGPVGSWGDAAQGGNGRRGPKPGYDPPKMTGFRAVLNAIKKAAGWKRAAGCLGPGGGAEATDGEGDKTTAPTAGGVDGVLFYVPRGATGRGRQPITQTSRATRNPSSRGPVTTKRSSGSGRFVGRVGGGGEKKDR